MTNDDFSTHFGGAGRFAFFDVEQASRTIVGRCFATPPPHERGAFPMWLKGEGVNVVLAGGMGPRAVQIFQHFGIETVLGVGGGQPEQIVRDYLAGTLSASGEGCSGGHLHDCGHHEDGR
ncbi:MAG: NifB/NifX family molybdenum-iron cluster-binding protein [Acidobacteriota bacterium]